MRADVEREINPILSKFFRPEFLNRVDDIIVFNPISSSVLKQIVEIQVENYVKMLEKDKDIKISLDETSKQFLAKVGWDPVFGARPLKRAIQRYLLDELALDIIE
ncbi:MAG: hypothetical protein ACOZBL_03300 [Patescibacteria group bacterium]